MHVTSNFIYSEDGQARVLGLPYVGQELFMFVILPKERFGLQKLLSSLNGKKLAQYVANRDEKAVDVYLPRFKIESEFQLSEVLKKLGLKTLFDHPDLSGIAAGSLRVSEVYHKAFIEV